MNENQNYALYLHETRSAFAHASNYSARILSAFCVSSPKGYHVYQCVSDKKQNINMVLRCRLCCRRSRHETDVLPMLLGSACDITNARGSHSRKVMPLVVRFYVICFFALTKGKLHKGLADSPVCCMAVQLVGTLIANDKTKTTARLFFCVPFSLQR